MSPMTKKRLITAGGSVCGECFMSELLNLPAEPAELFVADLFHVQMIDALREKQFGNAGVKDAFDLILIVGDISLIDIIEVALVGVDDELNPHAAEPGKKLEHGGIGGASRVFVDPTCSGERVGDVLQGHEGVGRNSAVGQVLLEYLDVLGRFQHPHET
jgi:hypothetical protein